MNPRFLTGARSVLTVNITVTTALDSDTWIETDDGRWWNSHTREVITAAEMTVITSLFSDPGPAAFEPRPTTDDSAWSRQVRMSLPDESCEERERAYRLWLEAERALAEYEGAL